MSEFSTGNDGKGKKKIDNKKSPKITFNVNDIEDSKYDGKPLITPKIPYRFKVK